MVQLCKTSTWWQPFLKRDLPCHFIRPASYLVLGSCRSGVEQVKPRDIGEHALLLIGLVGATGYGQALRGEGRGQRGRKGSKLSVITEMALIEALLQPHRCLVIPWEYLLYSKGA